MLGKIFSEEQEEVSELVNFELELRMYEVDYDDFLWYNHRPIQLNSRLVPDVQLQFNTSIKLSLWTFYSVRDNSLENTYRSMVEKLYF